MCIFILDAYVRISVVSEVVLLFWSALSTCCKCFLGAHFLSNACLHPEVFLNSAANQECIVAQEERKSVSLNVCLYKQTKVRIITVFMKLMFSYV